MHEAVARLPMALALLSLPVTARIGDSLRTAVADLHNLADWACFDTGDTGDPGRCPPSAHGLRTRRGARRAAVRSGGEGTLVIERRRGVHRNGEPLFLAR
ncbi:hypothetical protein [Saccharothrix deserti]|uniref:hypothetical protein n=1 Tax=Saccharothrix deserti TaxID=2593674 RepID=UPI00131B1C9A|nr:hypothetical protein [Saccharothrix deserti]